MPRKPPVSRAEVAAAIKAIENDGGEASTRAIREHIGHGSYTTIADHVAAIRAGAETPERQLASLPAQVEAPLRDMLAAMGDLAMQRTNQERESLEQRRLEIEQRWSGLLMEKDAAVQAFESEQRLTAELRLRLATESQKLEAAQKELAEWKPRAIKAEALNDQMNTRLAESSRRIDELKSNLDNLEAQTKLQRQRDIDAHNSQVAQLQQAIDAGHGNELRLTEQLGQVQRACEKLEASLREETRRANDAVTQQAKLQALVADLSVAQTESEKLAARHETQLAEAIAARDAMSEKLGIAQSNLIAAQDRIEQLRVSGSAESRALILNLIDHSRRVFAHAKGVAKKTDPDFQELGIAQREIERLFGGDAAPSK